MRLVRYTALVLAAVLGGSLLAGCGLVSTPSATPIPPAASQLVTAPPAAQLPKVEVNSYKGKRLDVVKNEPLEAIKGVQHVDVRTYRLAVTGLVKNPLNLTYAQATALPAYQKVTTLNCVEGWSVTYLWQGILLKDLLAKAGASPRAKIVIFRCADGYSTSLPVDYVQSRNILLAYRMNGVVMPAENGFPFQVVAEDQLGYKWAKWVTGIEVSDNTNFRGYWESRGYDNSATVPGSK